MTDLILAIAHHLLVFSLVAIIAAELVLVRDRLDGAALTRLGSIDLAYGVVAAGVLIVGFSRVFFGVKGPAAYLPNPFFWAKIGVFVLVGLLSVPPTLRILRWGRQARAEPGFSPTQADLRHVRRFLWAEAALLPFIPAFAAVMARGYGLG